MELASVPIFRHLSAEQQRAWLALAEHPTCQADEVLFYEGDTPTQLHLVAEGRVALTRGGAPYAVATVGDLLDWEAAAGELPHRCKATAQEHCSLLTWDCAALFQDAAYGAAARRALAQDLSHTQDRRDELAAPIQYGSPRGELQPGPFQFEHVTMCFAFCEADKRTVQALLPPRLSLLQRPLRHSAPVLLVFADFPQVMYAHNPEAMFGYRETTVFIPVRYQTAFGFFVPYVYPSGWEAILLGREIYGFPKQLGNTLFQSQKVTLHTPTGSVTMRWEGANAAEEPRLVRALSDWLGIEGRFASTAFGAGELLRKAVRLPAHRRVDVYLHKRIPAPESTTEAPAWAVDELVRATFGVLRWYQIAELKHLSLTVEDSTLGALDLSIREAYRTQLDMRLGTGRTVEGYLR